MTHELMTAEHNLQRIMWTGTLWFIGATGTVAIVSGLLLATGWRPGELPTPLAIIWWIGAGLMALSIGLIGWSGCPILEVSVPVSNRNKSLTMQFGTAIYIISGAACLVAVLLGPAH